MIKLKDLLTENRIRNIERSEVAHVNKAFERLVKGIDKSWDIEADLKFYNFNDGTRFFQLIARKLRIKKKFFLFFLKKL